MVSAAAFAAGLGVGAAAGAGAVAAYCSRTRRRRGRLLSFALHEVNTPATAVNMTIVNLLSGVFGEVPADQHKWLEMARDQVARLCALTSELRDLTHLELQTNLHLYTRPADPAELVEEVLTPMRAGFAQAGVELKAEVEPGLPKVVADSDRLPREIAGLLYHARKFRAGGAVVLRARRAGDAVEFAAEYRGAYIPPEEAQASLELYYPAIPRKDHILAASGLGLGLTRRLARLGGGDLTLECAVDGATRLALTVPLAREG
jgi:signal transduction histidine kinase